MKLPSYVRPLAYYTLVVVATLTVLITLLSLWQNTPVWWLKVLDFPRVQLLVVAVGCLAVGGMMQRRWTWGAGALALGLLVAIGWQLYFVLPYTPLHDVRLVDATDPQPATTVRLLQANVLQKNRNATALLAIIRRAHPDVILLEETNRWWASAVDSLRRAYPHTLAHPTDNTYGMLLFSRLPLRASSIRFLQHPNVPSFHLQLQMPDGRWVNLHTLHPVPPVPSEHPYNQEKPEAEVHAAGDLIQQDSLPILVIGDFNDVAWGHTDRLLHAADRVRDARVGRGLYATFKRPVLALPLAPRSSLRLPRMARRPAPAPPRLRLRPLPLARRAPADHSLILLKVRSFI